MTGGPNPFDPDDMIDAERALEGKPPLKRADVNVPPSTFDTPSPGEVEDEGTGLNIPTISVPGAAANPYGHVEPVIDDIRQKAPSTMQQAVETMSKALAFLPPAWRIATLVAIFGIAVFGVTSVLGTFASCGAAVDAPCPQSSSATSQPTAAAAATGAATVVGTARPTATTAPALTPLTVQAGPATYANAAGTQCGYSVFFVWIIPGYSHEQVTIHLRDLSGRVDTTQRFTFPSKPLPTMPTDGHFLGLGGSYLEDKQQLVYIYGDEGATAGYTAEITFIGNHPLRGELVSTAGPHSCG